MVLYLRKKYLKGLKMKNLIAKFNNLSKKKRVAIVVSAAALVLVISMFLVLYCNGYSGLHNHSIAKQGQIKVACVGDSITYGHGISGWARNNYPAQLQKILGDEYHVENFGHSGTTASSKGDKPYNESPQYELSLEYNADIVIALARQSRGKRADNVAKSARRSKRKGFARNVKYLFHFNLPSIIIC